MGVVDRIVGRKTIWNETTKDQKQEMINSLLTNLSTGWHVMRWLRLGLALFVAYQAIVHHDALAGVVSVLFFIQVITNRGCCGATHCADPHFKQESDDHDGQSETKMSRPGDEKQIERNT